MRLDTDLYQPAELTGRARVEVEEYDYDDTFARWLPNEYIESNTATYHVVEGGARVEEARYRAFDAEPEPSGRQVERVEKSVKLPALSQKNALSEQSMINLRTRGDAVVRNEINANLSASVKAIMKRIDRQRIEVLKTGHARAAQRNFKFMDDFGRDPRLTTTAANLWTDPSVSRLEYLTELRDLYEDINEQTPGVFVMDRAAATALAAGSEFTRNLDNGLTLPGNMAIVNEILSVSGLPPIEVSLHKGIDRGGIFILPTPGNPNDASSSELGSTTWGITLTADIPSFGIEDSAKPGIVAGVYAPETIPYIHEVMADSVNLPILKQPNLSGYTRVLGDR